MNENFTMDDSMQKLKREINAGINVINRDEFSDTIRAIASIAADAVSKTLGPYAKTTIIDDGHFTYPTKDGWTVLSRITFPDPLYQSIFKTIRAISFRIVEAVGDGTTTAMVVANFFIEAVMEEINSGRFDRERQTDIVKALKNIKDEICDELKKMAISIRDPEDSDNYSGIFHVASISSNGNIELARIMEIIYQETGNPNVLVDMGGSMTEDVSYEIQHGYRLDCAPIMHQLYINTSEKYYDTNNKPHHVVIFDHNVSYNKHGMMFEKLINYVNMLSSRDGQEHCLMVIAPYFDDLISSSIMTMINKMLSENRTATPNVMLVQVPELTRQDQRNFLNDFAAIGNIAITNATTVKIFNEFVHNEKVVNPEDIIRDNAMELDDYKEFTTAQSLMESCCGVIRSALIGKNFISLNDIDKESVRYKKALVEAQADYDVAVEEVSRSTTTLMNKMMQASDRLNRLSGEIGIIHVGGGSDLERQCTMDIVDDTFRACRSAYENGVVPGLNMGTLVAIRRVASKHNHTELEEIVLQILQGAFCDTTLKVLQNKYSDVTTPHWDYPDFNSTKGERIKLDSMSLINRLIMDTDEGRIPCYDIVWEEVPAGILPCVLNSVSTDIEILNGVVSILSLILTSDQYLSISRFYDKTAAAKMQEAANARALENDTTSILRSIDKHLQKNPTSAIGTLIGRILK